MTTDPTPNVPDKANQAVLRALRAESALSDAEAKLARLLSMADAWKQVDNDGVKACGETMRMTIIGEW